MKIEDLTGPLVLREDVYPTPSGNGVMWFHEYCSDVLEKMIIEFRSGQYPQAPWKVVPAARLIRIWQDHAAKGFVRNEKGLEAIRDQIIENIARLSINTDLAGHAEADPEEMLADYFDGEPIEEFVEWAVDCPGGWRISDYGFPRLSQLAALMYEADTPEDLLVYIDQVLNVTHQRSDLASWFVEGGSATLDKLAHE